MNGGANEEQGEVEVLLIAPNEGDDECLEDQCRRLSMVSARRRGLQTSRRQKLSASTINILMEE